MLKIEKNNMFIIITNKLRWRYMDSWLLSTLNLKWHFLWQRDGHPVIHLLASR